MEREYTRMHVCVYVYLRRHDECVYVFMYPYTYYKMPPFHLLGGRPGAFNIF
jgi:hypothetical protein